MDARVDNRREICEALDSPVTPTSTDSEIILAAYDTWGLSCFERLAGAFAVVIYDRRRQQIVCARDHMGIKPFYYTLRDDLFAFGSEPKSILALSDVSDESNDVSVFAFLDESFEDPEATFFEAVNRLPSGHLLVVKPGMARKESYWSLDPTYELSLPSDDAYERQFRQLFTEAVRCRLRTPGDRDLVSYLSGGLDSTSIACTATSMLGSEVPLHTFSVTHTGYPGSDESDYLDAALEDYDFEAEIIDGGGMSPLVNLDERLTYHDAPFYPPLFSVPYLLGEHAAEEDFRVLLDGIGGDQTLHYGTGYLSELLVTGKCRRFVTELNALADQTGTSKRELLLRNVGGTFAPRPVRLAWQFVTGNGGTERQTPIIDTAAAAEAGYDRTSPGERPSSASHRETHKEWLVDAEQRFFLETIDTELARAGIEPRYPFFDRRLVEFCLALPIEQKIRNGIGRQILRRSLRGVLPEMVRTRTDKANFIPSWRAGLHDHELTRIRERLVKAQCYVSTYLDDGVLEAAYHRFSDEPSYRDGWNLAKAYAAETWFRRRVGDAYREHRSVR